MNIDLDLKRFKKRIDKIQKNITKNKDKTLKKIGVYLNSEIKALFNKKVTPFGKAWKPAKSNPNTLIKSGDLMKSGRVEIEGNRLVISYGNGLDYARFHNDGIGQEKRQFIPNRGKLPKEWKKEALKELKKGIFK